MRVTVATSFPVRGAGGWALSMQREIAMGTGGNLGGPGTRRLIGYESRNGGSAVRFCFACAGVGVFISSTTTTTKTTVTPHTECSWPWSIRFCRRLDVYRKAICCMAMYKHGCFFKITSFNTAAVSSHTTQSTAATSVYRRFSWVKSPNSPHMWPGPDISR